MAIEDEIIWATSTTGEEFQCVDASFAREQAAEIEKLKEALRWCISHAVSYSSAFDQFLDNDGSCSTEIDPPEDMNDVLREVARSL